MKKLTIFFITVFAVLTVSVQVAFPHCDTMDGPVIIDAKLAFEKNNVNYVLKWVRPADENEIKKAFIQVMRVRSLNADAKEVAEKYFFDTLVRIHRAGEGVGFTGVKPSGATIDEKVKAADKALELGNIGPLEIITPKEKLPKLKELFNKAISLKNYDINDVKAGREYIEAYVKFFHFAEGAEGHQHGDHAEHLVKLIPIVLSIIFFISTIIFGVLYYRRRK